MVASWAGPGTAGLDEGDDASVAATLAGVVSGAGAGDRSAVWAVSDRQLVAATGLVSDAQVLVGWARRLLLQRGSVYGAPLSTGRLASALAERVHAGTTSSGRRAFATDMLVLGHDGVAAHSGGGGGSECGDDHVGMHIFQVSPAGQLRSYRAVAIGRGAPAANKRLAALLERKPSDGSEGESKDESEGQSEIDHDVDSLVAVALEALVVAHVPELLNSAVGGDGRDGSTDDSADEGDGDGDDRGAPELASESAEVLRSVLKDLDYAASTGALRVMCGRCAGDDEGAGAAGGAEGAGGAAAPSFVVVEPAAATSLLRGLAGRRRWLARS